MENEKENGMCVSLLVNEPILLEKCSKPDTKAKKKEALHRIILRYTAQTGKVIDETSMKKKISNMKQRYKEKIDKKRTGNVRIVLNEWERKLGDLLDVGSVNPVYNRLQGAIDAGLPETNEPETVAPLVSSISASTSLATSSSTSASFTSSIIKTFPGIQSSRSKLPETDVTRSLTDRELQRLVLLEQLELIQLKKAKLKEE